MNFNLIFVGKKTCNSKMFAHELMSIIPFYLQEENYQMLEDIILPLNKKG